MKDTEYPTVITETMENTLSEFPKNAYWSFVDNYPESHDFSFERILTHEAYHALQPDSRLLYSLNPSQFESPVIKQTNDFMWTHFREPARDPNWH